MILETILSFATAALVVTNTVIVTRKVSRVHDEVKTSNGLTMAALADRAEGRRIDTDIPTAERTTSEQHYVDNLDE